MKCRLGPILLFASLLVGAVWCDSGCPDEGSAFGGQCYMVVVTIEQGGDPSAAPEPTSCKVEGSKLSKAYKESTSDKFEHPGGWLCVWLEEGQWSEIGCDPPAEGSGQKGSVCSQKSTAPVTQKPITTKKPTKPQPNVRCPAGWVSFAGWCFRLYPSPDEGTTLGEEPPAPCQAGGKQLSDATVQISDDQQFAHGEYICYWVTVSEIWTQIGCDQPSEDGNKWSICKYKPSAVVIPTPKPVTTTPKPTQPSVVCPAGWIPWGSYCFAIRGAPEGTDKPVAPSTCPANAQLLSTTFQVSQDQFPYGNQICSWLLPEQWVELGCQQPTDDGNRWALCRQKPPPINCGVGYFAWLGYCYRLMHSDNNGNTFTTRPSPCSVDGNRLYSVYRVGEQFPWNKLICAWVATSDHWSQLGCQQPDDAGPTTWAVCRKKPGAETKSCPQCAQKCSGVCSRICANSLKAAITKKCQRVNPMNIRDK